MPEASEQPGNLSGLMPCYWGSVNQWECDENDHLNVRYYAHKINQALQIYLSRITDMPADTVPARVQAQHIRFLRESRSATPLRVDCALLDRDGTHLDVLSMMHDNVTGDAVAAFSSRLNLHGASVIAPDTVEAPQQARPRGLEPAELPAPPASWNEARECGFRIVGRGVIEAGECDAAGRLLPHGYIGRVSDGMPNLWALLNPPPEQAARGSGELGGAALEQRLEIHSALQAGSVYCQLSGVRALGNKTQQMAHVLYDETHDRVAATLEAVGVAMDLTTRRAVTISPERRALLEKLLLRSGS